MNRHTTTVHARCPYMPVWDYYEITIETPAFIRCEEFEAACEELRGKELTQEDLATYLRDKLPERCRLTVSGRHGANCRTEVCL